MAEGCQLNPTLGRALNPIVEAYCVQVFVWVSPTGFCKARARLQVFIINVNFAGVLLQASCVRIFLSLLVIVSPVQVCVRGWVSLVSTHAAWYGGMVFNAHQWLLRFSHVRHVALEWSSHTYPGTIVWSPQAHHGMVIWCSYAQQLLIVWATLSAPPFDSTTDVD